MEIEELKQFCESSDFTPETKHKIATVLAGKAVLDYDTYAAVKEILQQELDSDFAEAGVDLSDDPEAQAEEAKYEAEMHELDKLMEGDMDFIEKEKADLDTMSANE